MPTVTYYNGSFLEAGEPAVPVEERGHQFGDGVYEVARIYGGRPFLLDWHMERLERSLRVIGLTNPMTRPEWVELIHDAIRRSGEGEANVYFHVTRGIAPRNHLFPPTDSVVSLTVRPVSAPNRPGASEEGFPNAKLLAWPDERHANAYVKTINLLPNVIAKEVAHRHHAAEALLVRQSVVTECAGSNAWFVQNGALWTHPANRYILGGITRRFVMQLASDLNIAVHERAVPLADLSLFDGAFITSTTNELLPIGEIVVHDSKKDALSHLPEAAPNSLVEEEGALSTLWTAKHNPASSRSIACLQEAYQQAVESLRSGAGQPAVR